MAKALDVIGDRWSLLIVRELALRACRYSDLQDGLPGISTNLLADRLRELEQHGVILRREPEPPVATAVFELTEHGQGLVPLLKGLMSWGTRYMMAGPAPEDSFRIRWMTWPAETFLQDADTEAGQLRIKVDTGEEAATILAGAAGVSVGPLGEGPWDATLTGTPHLLLGLFMGLVELDAALQAGVRIDGERSAVERLLSAGAASDAPRAGALAR